MSNELILFLMLGFLGTLIFRVTIIWTNHIRKDVAESGRKFPLISFIIFLVSYWGAYIFLVYLGFSKENVLNVSNLTLLGYVLITVLWVTTINTLIPFIIYKWSPNKFFIAMVGMSLFIAVLTVMLTSRFMNTQVS